MTLVILLPSETSQAQHPLSSFLSTFLSSKLSQDSLSCYGHAMPFPAKYSNCFNNPLRKQCGQAHHSNTPYPGTNMSMKTASLTGPQVNLMEPIPQLRSILCKYIQVSVKLTKISTEIKSPRAYHCVINSFHINGS